MLYKIENTISTHVWVLQRIETDGMHLDVENSD
jgi:hypothetical protein